MNHPIRPKKTDPILYAELAQLLIDFQDAHPGDWRTRVEHCCDRIGPYVDHMEAEEDQELVVALPDLPVIPGLDDEEIAAFIGYRH